METLSQPLNLQQIELLKLFKHDIPEADWQELRTLISQYFLEKAKNEADKVWAKNAWTDEDAYKMLHQHERRKSV